MRVEARPLQSEQDVYLSRIVNKQHHQQHQQHQQQQHSHQWTDNHPSAAVYQGGSVADGNNCNQSNLLGKGREFHSEKCNPAWTETSGDGSGLKGAVRHKGEDRQDLTVWDVTADDSDARSSVSLLESESIYLPLSEVSPPTPQRPTPTSNAYLASHHSRLPLSAHLYYHSPSSDSSAGFPSLSPASNLPAGNSPANFLAGFPSSSPASNPSAGVPASNVFPNSSSRSNPASGVSGVNLPSRLPSSIPATNPSSGASAATGLPVSCSSSSPRAQTSPETKYESRERRVIRPFNQEASRFRSRLTGSTRPQASDAEPTTHTPRSFQRPATASSQDYDMSLEPSPLPDRTSATPSPSTSPRPLPLPNTSSSTSATSSSSVPAAHVSLIHRVADSRRIAKEQQQQAMRHTPPPPSSAPSGGQTSHIPTSTTHHHHQHNQQQQHSQAKVSSGSNSSRSRVKALDSNHQAKLSKIVKCQQNAERLNQHKDHSAPGPHLSTDSGFQSRPSSDAVLNDYGHEGQTAATLIQSMWRGYWAREHSLDVVSIRKEIRARRAEDHIVLLRADLDRHKKLYNEEKRLRTLQMEAIRRLYYEIQQLKAQVQGQGSTPNSRPGTADSTLSSAPSGTSSSFPDLQRTAELERTCQSLQSQVSQLQQALQSMTNHVFRQDSMEFNSLSSTADADFLSSVQVLECHDNHIHSADTQNQGSVCHWSSIPHSLSPYPSEEEEVYFRQVPHHGAPTPPRSLTLQHRGENSILLHWLPSRVSIDHSTDVKPVVVGYRVYINDQVRGTISSHKTVALVSGLSPAATYKFYVKAASNSGESYESNIVIARLARGSERQQQPSDSSESDVPPDSDKDRDSSDMVDKRRLRKRESRKHRKVRSPRSEKKLPRGETTKQGEDSGGASKEGREEGVVRDSTGAGEGSQAAQQQEDGSVGILMQPKLHKHRRQRSKEQSELSSLQSDSPGSTPSRQGEDSRPPSRATPTPTPPPTSAPPSSSSLSQNPAVHQRRAGSPARDLSFKASSPALDRKGSGDRSSPGSQDGDSRKVSTATPPAMLETPPPSETPVVLSETFTVDKAKSFLHNLDTPANNSAGGTAEDAGCSAKGQKRIKEATTSVPHKDRSSPDRGSGGGASGQVADLRSDVRTHRRTRSRDLTTPTPGDERERCSTPVLDGRRRTNSRPSSPMIFEGPAIGSSQRELDSGGTELARRMTTAENFAQRLRKSPSPSCGAGGGGGGGRDVSGEEGGVEKKSPQHGPSRSRKHSASPDSLPDSSQDETTRLHHSSSSLRHRTHSVGSESDLVSAFTSGRKEVSITSLLDQITRSLTGSRLRKRSSEEEERKRPSSGRTRNLSESDNDMSSDPGSHLPPKAPSSAAAAAGSDSSSGSHSDDSKARSHRHRRSPSDQRPITTSGYNSDQVTGRHTHSPIIMEGGNSKKGSSNVRRNASFHALPSRPPDSQPSPAPEEMASGGAVGGRREEVTSPQESQGNPRSSIRSRSPSPGRNRQPVLSGAQLKRQTSDARQLPDPRPGSDLGKPAS